MPAQQQTIKKTINVLYKILKLQIVRRKKQSSKILGENVSHTFEKVLQ
jgi:uncharacterized ubiquitin-like protein YukD